MVQIALLSGLLALAACGERIIDRQGLGGDCTASDDCAEPYVCAAQVCTFRAAPGDCFAPTCQGDLLLKCTEDHQFVLDETCAGSCFDGACVSCGVGAARCLGNDRQTCVDGAFVTDRTCDHGCVDGGCL